MRRRSLIFATALSASLILFALFDAWLWLADGPERDQGGFRKFSVDFFDTFDTLVSFTAFAKDEAEFHRYEKIFRDEMGRLHRLFDIYNDYEGLVNLKTLNDHAGGAPLHVDPSVVTLLEIAKDAHDNTDGAVNVALGPVLAVWHQLREQASVNSNDISIPTPEELKAAASHTSVHDVVIDREKSAVSLRHRDMRLDVGALAKGYAVQKTVELLLETGLKSGLVNAGGNVVVVGAPLDGRETWNIGVRRPNGTSPQGFVDVLSLAKGAVVTSGNDQRYFMAGGRRYHHIIDPQTLYPAEGVRSVTVLHPNSTTADVLSTAAFILPQDKARALVAQHGAEAMWLASDGTKFATPGYLRLTQDFISP